MRALGPTHASVAILPTEPPPARSLVGSFAQFVRSARELCVPLLLPVFTARRAVLRELHAAIDEFARRATRGAPLPCCAVHSAS